MPLNEVDVHHRLNDDLEFFAQHAPLVIKDDQGQLIPWKLNIAQRYAEMKVQEQLRKFGFVRALVMKGRQQGVSTWVHGRYYHRTTRKRGISTLIISHEGKTTDKLFDMVRRFQDNIHPALKPQEGKSNTRQMTFPGLSSEYSAITAGSEQAGRGFTSQLIHGSEVAYWEHAYDIQDGALESIRLAPGTEIILESTANGPVGLFYEKCQGALKGLGDYILIFIPWFWESDYERDVPADFELTVKETAYIERYFLKPFPFCTAPPTAHSILRKLMWRRHKIFDFSPTNPAVGEAKFHSVYPSNPIEAFLSTAIGEIRSDAIDVARSLFNTLELDSFMPRIGGLDPASEKKRADRSILVIRQGRVFEKAYRLKGLNSMEQVGRVVRMINEEKLDMLFVDNGYGKQMVDRLNELGYGRKVMGVWFNEAASDPNLYSNKRSEMLLQGADWTNEGGVSIPSLEATVDIDANVSLCSGDEVHADFAALPMHKTSSNGVKSVLPKEEMIKVLGRSPDIFDAFALTFARPVHCVAQQNVWRRADDRGILSRNGHSPLRSLARKRQMK